MFSLKTLGVLNHLFFFSLNLVNIGVALNCFEKLYGASFYSFILFKYLTFWNVILQTVYFGVSLVLDLVSSSRNNRSRNKYLSLIYHSLLLPLALYVFTFFWLVYIYDRELIFPRKLASYFPLWHNHAIHTFIIVSVLLEGFCYRFRPPTRRSKLAAWTLLFILYAINMFYFGISYNDWIYPILQVLNYSQKALFILVSYIFTLFMLFLSEKVYKLIS